MNGRECIMRMHTHVMNGIYIRTWQKPNNVHKLAIGFSCCFCCCHPYYSPFRTCSNASLHAVYMLCMGSKLEPSLIQSHFSLFIAPNFFLVVIIINNTEFQLPKANAYCKKSKIIAIIYFKIVFMWPSVTSNALNHSNSSALGSPLCRYTSNGHILMLEHEAFNFIELNINKFN